MRAETYGVKDGALLVAYASICGTKVVVGTNLSNSRARKDVFVSKDASALFDMVKRALEQLQAAINR